jgi:thiol:disulfide interchange protein
MRYYHSKELSMLGLKHAAQTLVLVGLAASLAAASQSVYDEKADAGAQIRAAIAEASKSNKNIILDFGGNWCFDCHVLDQQMRGPELAPLIEKNYVVVHVDVGRFDKNLELARKYHVPLKKGVPALAVLDSKGNLLYAQEEGQFEDARHLSPESIRRFFEKWKPRERRQ